jgi:acyl-coenzyme A thioesterase PaaI-like protein
VPEAAIALDELRGRLAAEFPEAFRSGSSLSILTIAHGMAHLRYAFRPKSLRPGGTISGTTMMILADATMYVAVLASIGWVPLAVTTNLSINFLKKPGPRALEAECRLLSSASALQSARSRSARKVTTSSRRTRLRPIRFLQVGGKIAPKSYYIVL